MERLREFPDGLAGRDAAQLRALAERNGLAQAEVGLPQTRATGDVAWRVPVTRAGHQCECRWIDPLRFSAATGRGE